MSILTQMPAIPTAHDGVDIDPQQLAAAVLYLGYIHGADIVPVLWDSAKKPLAAHKHHTIKSHGYAMCGRGVEHKDQNGGQSTGPMQWGTWLLYPWIKIHKGNLYARLYPIMSTIDMSYTCDGEAITRAEYAAMMPKRAPSKNPVLTIDVRIMEILVG